jgi:transposase
MEVDWAESTLILQNLATGEKIPVYVFIATLPYSQYIYVEGFKDMNSTSRLTAHIHALG